MLKIQGVLETAVYVDDMERAHYFYNDVLGLERMFEGERLFAYNAGPNSVLLVFQRGGATEDLETPGGTIPGHNSVGPAHFALRIVADTYERWKLHIVARNVAILSEVQWPAGGQSFYFNDPDGNVVELATPGNWPNDLNGPD